MADDPTEFTFHAPGLGAFASPGERCTIEVDGVSHAGVVVSVVDDDTVRAHAIRTGGREGLQP